MNTLNTLKVNEQRKREVMCNQIKEDWGGGIRQ